MGLVPALRSSAPLVSDRVFATLLEAVLAGRYEPGEKLPGQRKLAADLGVTMSSLREALKRLEQMGLVEVRHGDAMRVRDWRTFGGLDVLAHLLFRTGSLDPAVLGDVLEARSHMLRDLAGLAAERRDDAQSRRLAELAEAFAQAPDATAAAGVDFAFMSELAQAAGNLVFILILNAVRGVYFEHLEQLPVTARPEGLAPAYARLAEAVAARDAGAARAVAHALAEDQRARVTGALGPERRP
ncbi:MAG: regulatory protein GntR [Solirubrobacterales bacterium]|nr:regulatory protein GntR [Solirubrobacterales bacterium]